MHSLGEGAFREGSLDSSSEKMVGHSATVGVVVLSINITNHVVSYRINMHGKAPMSFLCSAAYSTPERHRGDYLKFIGQPIRKSVFCLSMEGLVPVHRLWRDVRFHLPRRGSRLIVRASICSERQLAPPPTTRLIARYYR